MFKKPLIGLLIAGSFISIAHAATSPAQETVAQFLDAIKQIDFAESDSGEYRDVVSTAMHKLDLDTLAEMALRDHWRRITDSEKTRFVALLSELVEHVAYPRSQKFLGDLEIRYSEEIPIEDGVEIAGEVIRENEALNAEVLYRLHLKNEHWMIYDIILDGVSITEDLHYQWDKVIKDSSFSVLLTKMQEKLAESLSQKIAGDVH